MSNQTMSDSLPAVIDTIKGILDDHGPLVLSNALRKLGWEGRDLDKVAEQVILDEVHQHDLFDTQSDLHDYNGEKLTTDEIVHREQLDEARDDEVW